ALLAYGGPLGTGQRRKERIKFSRSAGCRTDPLQEACEPGVLTPLTRSRAFRRKASSWAPKCQFACKSVKQAAAIRQASVNKKGRILADPPPSRPGSKSSVAHPDTGAEPRTERIEEHRVGRVVGPAAPA